MAAPLPSGSSLQALPVAPSINPMQGVANNDPFGNMAKGIDYAGQFARLGQLRSKIELEDAQRKADMAKSKADLLEADLIQRDLEDKFNSEKAQRALALELATLQAQTAKSLAPLQITGAEVNLDTAKTQGLLANLNLKEAESVAGFNQDTRALARKQFAEVSVPGVEEVAAPAATASPTGVVSPFTPTVSYREWMKPQIAAFILENRRPVLSTTKIAKEIGVKQEKRPFVDPNSGAEYEVDVLTGPAGEIFKVTEPRFVKASAMQASVDKQFADDVADFVSGGAVKAKANIAKLDNAIATLLKPTTMAASGPLVGLTPEKLRKTFSSDESLGVKNDVESVIQESLKAILGAQFAQKEAEQLLSRSYDLFASEEANAKRLGVLKSQLQNALDARLTAVDYFQKNGTLAGMKYVAPTFGPTVPGAGTDLDSGIPAGTAAPRVSTAPGAEIRVDPVSGRRFQRINGVVTEIGR